MHVRLLLGALILCSAALAAAADSPSPRVELFSPEGTTKAVRQVLVRFSVPMVALGDPRLPDPFTVSCPAPGSGRWADPNNWVYDFSADLPAGVRCRFTLRPDLKSAGGERLSGRTSYGFDTGGPAILASLPREGWSAIDEDQVFILRLDAPAAAASVAAHAWCAIDGVAERIPVQVLAGAPRAQILAERRALGYDYFRLLWKDGAESDVRVRNRSLESQEATLEVLRCARRLPPGTRVILTWGAQIRSASGIATATDQILAFEVRAAFRAEVQCTRTNARAGCMPVQPLTVSFTAPVPREQALAIRLKTRDGKLLAPEPQRADQAPTLDSISFPGPLPAASTVTVLLPEHLLDDAGRALENAARFPLEVTIDEFPPLVKFSGEFGILEAREGGVLPVTLRNVEAQLPARRVRFGARLLKLEADPAAISAWLQRVEEANAPRGLWRRGAHRTAQGPDGHYQDLTGSESVFAPQDATQAFTVKKPLGPQPEEVIGIPLKQPGFYVVELESRVLGEALLGEERPRYVSTAALVTDLAVHLKWGRERSLVWVTRLSTGAPVAGARVTVRDNCSGQELWQGVSDAQGRALIERSMGDPPRAGCYQARPLMVLARVPGDFSFTCSDWNQGITPYEFGVPVGNPESAAIAHTVLDRALFRAGETVSMKHYLRRHVLAGLALPEAHTHKVEIRHVGSGESFPIEARFDELEVATSRWQIPAEAKLGDYAVEIDSRESAHFQVAQFRLPTMRASVSGPAQAQIAPPSVTLALHVGYLSGGSAAGLPVKLRTFIEPQPLHLPDYPDYEFGGAPVRTGVVSGTGAMSDIDFESAEAQPPANRVRTTPLTLDASGSAQFAVQDLAAPEGPARLVAELEYADSSGETLTATGTVRLLPAALSVGIRSESWVGSPGQLRFRVLVVDAAGRPQPAQQVSVALYQANAYSYRRRLLGGFYSYETLRETKQLAPTCQGATDAQGLLACEVAPQASGQILVRAETRDTAGRIAGATVSMWAVSQDEWWFGGTSGDRVDVLPEKKEYEPGETARLQVRMPFRAATALVTVEREGVMRSFVTRLTGAAPVIEVPLEGADAPNVYVSVLAIRGRVSAVSEGRRTLPEAQAVTALVDLTKPSYRLGTAQLRVGWRTHRLEVRVTPQREVYRSGESVPVTIRVSAADGTALAPGSEVAVAAVDEALLDLAPNPSWELLESMMGQRGLEVWTATAQMQVVGKRHYGRKAIPHGGGGGRDGESARQLFDSLLLWQPHVRLDAQGEASLTVPLNDSLSSFRIVAVAQSGVQRFGTGAATVHTTQDLILLSGLPPLVREGDRYLATVTVRNTTAHALAAHLEARAGALRAALSPQEVEVAAGGARDVSWPVTAPVGVTQLDWDLSARAGAAADHLRVREQVLPAVPVRTYQATLAQLTAPLSLPARIPADAVPGRGGLEVTLRERLGGDLAGVTEYMSRYPYVCLEQQTSRAVALRDRALWDEVMRRLPAYLDGDGLLKYFPSESLRGDDTLTAYVLAIGAEAGWPVSEQDRLVGALTRFVEGRIVRDSALPTADLAVRKLQALDALSRYGAVRPELLQSVRIEPNLLPTSALIDLEGLLTRTPQVPDAAPRAAAARALLRARLNFQGTTLGFSTARTDALWWLMVSTDSNANRMLLSVLGRPEWRADVPRLVRGALARQQYGHWNTTVANAWGVLALEKFSQAFESTPVTGTTALSFGAYAGNVPWPQPPAAPALDLPWPQGPATLALAQHGTGAPWAMVRATAAIPLSAPLSSGFSITRSVTPVETQDPAHLRRGDVVRVHLELEAQADATWVVVDDPIPAGSSVLGSGLNGQSALLTRTETRAGWAWLAFEERRQDAFLAYYRFVPKGHWTLEYTLRLNNPGTFQLPPTRVEAMYAPEMLGELPNAAVTVGADGAP